MTTHDLPVGDWLLASDAAEERLVAALRIVLKDLFRFREAP